MDNTSDFRVRRVLEGWAREAPPLPDSRLPVSEVVLQRILPTLSAICSTPFETVLFQTAFTVAFFAATRISELLPKSKSDKSQRAIQVDNITIGEKGVLPMVWIIGHSIVFWAERHAIFSSRGTDLGLSAVATIRWAGRRGMLWGAFLPRVIEMAAEGTPPDVILIHLGENDLVRMPGLQLVGRMTSDLHQLRRRFPQATILWTRLLPRRAWPGARSESAINAARRHVNRDITRNLAWIGGRAVSHRDIRVELPDLFRGDGVHLSPRGCDLYLDEMSRAIGGSISDRAGGGRGGQAGLAPSCGGNGQPCH
ncbi:uncharacterized protein LOC121917774 isoform X1 [Sceloporus undulatus]|uniref:uncharacterized protein LOC121917774 isoform X1 n=1 Tax=Sceloporus undulatus TaxID=8520 RepID=UPI001C4C6B55|nr:uncharacterized protein LOC121917774 isoform X1 [Sceloporus undulatus]